MASLQAHALNMIVRAALKRRLRGNTDLVRVRRILEGQGLPPPALPAGVIVTPDVVGGIKGEWVKAGDAAGPTLLYLHGGGYFACSPRTHRPITAGYARRGLAVFVPDHRLAPEHPFPAALEDAEACWQGLLELGHAAEALTVSGDSAGGGLSLALMLALREKGAALPAAAALFSPWTDLAGTGASMRDNTNREAMFWTPGLASAASAYLGGTQATHPLASPHYADPAGLPPVLIHVGEREILRDDATRFAQAARAAGVSVDLRVWPVVPHVWQLARFVPEARQSLDQAAAFLRRRDTCNK